MKNLTLNHGRFLVKHARAVIESHFGAETPDIPKRMRDLMEKEHGVFVVLRGPLNVIRGCIGYAESPMPLNRAVPEVALSAALRDHKFPPVRQSELKNLIVEVSLLTKPEHVKVDKPQDYPQNITVGRDGLIVHKDFSKGLLLPQFPVERGWNIKEFLSRTCIRGGFEGDSWSRGDITLYKFNARVFTELQPRGDVVERDLSMK
ncbi:MAG: TIGR00296 family protein [Candidatus Altiarchaeota archaeon]|nr:TIGR00296 family protein [Candidatus Altiarchaeota archaeon]